MIVYREEMEYICSSLINKGTFDPPGGGSSSSGGSTTTR